MREKLNDNPVAQVAVLGVLVLIVGFLLLTRMGGGAEEEAAPAPAATETAPATATTPAVPTDPAAPPADTGVAPVPGTTTDFKAGPGLPKAVVDAYDSGKVVVLLVVTKGGADDNKIKAIAESLQKQSSTTALFIVEAGQISDYSRIAQGVDVQQTPALVVLRPKNLTDGPQPTAAIEYGFRGPASVQQAIEDALYKGPNDLPYYPK
jgi:hypothetical protein